MHECSGEEQDAGMRPRETGCRDAAERDATRACGREEPVVEHEGLQCVEEEVGGVKGSYLRRSFFPVGFTPLSV